MSDALCRILRCYSSGDFRTLKKILAEAQGAPRTQRVYCRVVAWIFLYNFRQPLYLSATSAPQRLRENLSRKHQQAHDAGRVWGLVTKCCLDGGGDTIQLIVVTVRR